MGATGLPTGQEEAYSMRSSRFTMLGAGGQF